MNKVAFTILILTILFATNTFAATKLTWQANTETDLASYKLLHGTDLAEINQEINLPKESIEYELTEGEFPIGSVYYFQLSALDNSGNPSIPTTPVSVDRVQPRAPIVQNTGVALEWDANTEDGILGYRIQWSTESGNYDPANVIDVANTTEYALDGDMFPIGSYYYFTVTCYKAGGIESDASGEVSWDREPPVTPTNFQSVAE